MRERTWKGNTWQPQQRGRRRTARPRPTSATTRRTSGERARSTAATTAATTAAAMSTGEGAWNVPIPSHTASSVKPMPKALSNDASAASVPARAGHVARSSSRLPSAARTASPPRAESRPLSPAPQTYHAHTRRRVTCGHEAASTPRQATPRETCPQTCNITARRSQPTWAPAGADTAQPYSSRRRVAVRTS